MLVKMANLFHRCLLLWSFRQMFVLYYLLIVLPIFGMLRIVDRHYNLFELDLDRMMALMLHLNAFVVAVVVECTFDFDIDRIAYLHSSMCCSTELIDYTGIGSNFENEMVANSIAVLIEKKVKIISFTQTIATEIAF